MKITEEFRAILLYNEKRTRAFVAKLDNKYKINESNKRLERVRLFSIARTQALITAEMRECISVRVCSTQCPLCSWYGPLDSHRLIPEKDGGEYVAGNVINICPNCHRLLHRSQSQTTREAI